MTQDEAIALIKSGKNVFVTGGAGVGKSHVIKQIADKNTLVCAPTGIAALNVGGITAHKMFNLPMGIPTQEDMNKIISKAKKLLSNKHLKRVVLDECFKGDVEVLTEVGFVRFDEYAEGMRVAQFKAEDSSISFCDPVRFVNQEYEGEMVRLYSDHKIDLTCTAGHDLLFYKNSDGTLPVKQKALERIPATFKMMSAGFATGGSDSLSVDEKLCIAYQADGSTVVKEYSQRVGNIKMTKTRWGYDSKAGHGSICLSFKKDRKIDRFMSDFGTSVRNIRKEVGRCGYFTFHVNNVPSKYITKNFWEAFDLTEFSVNKAKEFIEYMSLWDGHINPNGAITYSNTNKKSVDFVQAVACLAGYRASVSKIIDNRSETFSDCYKVQVSKTTRHITMQKVNREVTQYKGKVYCVTVPEGNILVRSGRQVHVVGNCGIMRADYLDMIDHRLKQARGNQLPFGGIQIVLVGDLFQLNPIVSARENSLYFKKYTTPFAFGAKCWNFQTVVLDKVYRQANETHVKVLNSFRTADKWAARAFEWLGENCAPYDEEEDILHLCAYKVDAERTNNIHYSQVKAPERLYKGSTNNTKWSNDIPVPQIVKLKVGAKVIIRANDVNGEYVNGQRGTITELYASSAIVKLDSGECVEVLENTWEQYTYNATAKGLTKTVEFMYSQIPLQLGWSVTIHASQGLTLGRYAIDVGRGCFCHGMWYVAISRATDLTQVSLASNVGMRDLIVDNDVREFYRNVTGGNTA